MATNEGRYKTDLKEFNKEVGDRLVNACIFFDSTPRNTKPIGFYDEMVPGWGLERKWQEEEKKAATPPAPEPPPKAAEDPLGAGASEYLRKANMDRYNMSDGGFVRDDNQYWNIHEGRGAKPMTSPSYLSSSEQLFCTRCQRLTHSPHREEQCIRNLQQDVADLKKKALDLKQKLMQLTL